MDIAPAPPFPQMLARVEAGFAEEYGGAAEAVGFAPGRVNLIGEHLDYNGGPCLPIALRHGTWAALTRRGGVLRVRSGQRRADVPVELPGRGEWSDYVAGVLWAAAVPGAQVSLESSVPIGAGLSSSAALECAVGAALGLAGDDLVETGIRAEREYVGAPTGGLDQTVAVHGGSGQALLIDFADGSHRPVPFVPPYALLVVDTGVSHSLADGAGGYAERRAECARATAELGVELLARATDWDSLSNPILRRRARHVVTETARVHAAVAALEADDWHEFGRLMTESHRSLREDFEVSSAELDAVVEVLLGEGALGARMTGGGFGGSAIALMPPDRLDSAGAAVRARFAAAGWAPPTLLLAEAGPGAHRVR